ncbi:MAG: SUMF1/EgtB/PvdO family nonheme iron enzyme, partial [Defluviitaleaceae bacterium]|nr:SUMF1/EgtB/PvdO family nonheme iron enzyme [Defluviitaleaceae bacterium]
MKKIFSFFILIFLGTTIFSATIFAAPGTIPPVPFFTESAGYLFREDFRMVRVDAGTPFTLGWQSSGTGPFGTSPVNNVVVDTFFIAQTEVTQNLWRAVMGEPNALAVGTGFNQNGNRPQTSVTWYDVHLFLSRLYQLTGKRYRLATEAEWEFAAKGGNAPGANHSLRFAGSDSHNDVAVGGSGFSASNVATLAPNALGLYDMSGNVEEWTWNNWQMTHEGGTNPVGAGGHTQKTRRGGSMSGPNDSRLLTARQIRSIDGADGMLGFRIALSEDFESVPNGMTIPCEVRRPFMDDGAVKNSDFFRDERLITNDNFMWSGGFVSLPMKLWDNGDATIAGFGGGTFGRIDGQWYTVNNMALVIVRNNGERIKFVYIFMDENQMTVMSDLSGSVPMGRLTKVSENRAGNLRPTITNRRPASQLAAESPTYDHSLVDMDNIPHSARGKDSRLFSPSGSGWWMGLGMGGTHTYRKDIDENEFRFVVYQTVPPIAAGSTGTVLANGNWFTVNDCFLQVTHETGYVTQYLYTVTPGGEFRHISFQWYERGDSRAFTIRPNAETVGHTHEIPRGLGVSIYANRDDGQSTFRMPTYPLTVTGTGAGLVDEDGFAAYIGYFKQGETVNVALYGGASTLNFLRWTSSPQVVFSNPTSTQASFIMPARAVNITAVNSRSSVGVSVISEGTNFTGSGNFSPGATVTIFAGTAPSGKRFVRWASSVPDIRFTQVTPANSNVGRHTFVMPENSAVTVTAIFEPIPTFLTTVTSDGINSRGGGLFAQNARVEIFAGIPPRGYRFVRWAQVSSGGTVTISPQNNANASFTMPARPVIVSAVFEYVGAPDFIRGDANGDGA